MAHHGRRASGLFGVGSLFGRKDHPHPPSYYDELDRRHHRRRKSKRERDPHDHKRRRREHSPIVDAPDLEQLRRARAEYYGATPSERRREQPVRTAAAAAEMPDKKGRSTRQYAYTRRRHDNKHPSKKEREEKDSAVYVYSTPASGNQGSSRSSLRNKRQNVDDGPDQVDIIEVEREASPPPRADPPRRYGPHRFLEMNSLTCHSEPSRPATRSVLSWPRVQFAGVALQRFLPPPPKSHRQNPRRTSGEVVVCSVYFVMSRQRPPAQRRNTTV